LNFRYIAPLQVKAILPDSPSQNNDFHGAVVAVLALSDAASSLPCPVEIPVSRNQIEGGAHSLSEPRRNRDIAPYQEFHYHQPLNRWGEALDEPV
jgi:hypothetical protein